MTYRHPLAWLLGLEGAALLRAHAGDEGLGQAFVENRLAEVRALLAASLGEGVEVGRMSTVDGPGCCALAAIWSRPTSMWRRCTSAASPQRPARTEEPR